MIRLTHARKFVTLFTITLLFLSIIQVDFVQAEQAYTHEQYRDVVDLFFSTD